MLVASRVQTCSILISILIIPECQLPFKHVVCWVAFSFFFSGWEILDHQMVSRKSLDHPYVSRNRTWGISVLFMKLLACMKYSLSAFFNYYLIWDYMNGLWQLPLASLHFFFIPIKSFMHAAGLNFKCHNLRIKKLMTDHVNVLNLSVV